MTYIGVGIASFALLGLHTSCEKKKAQAENIGTDSVVMNDMVATMNTTQTVLTETSINVLTDAEKNEGWKLLFDGKTTTGWRGAYQDKFPAGGWLIENGTIGPVASGGAESRNGGDIVTIDEYDNFDLKFEFMLTDSANSGVKYYVVEHKPKPAGSAFGLEFQVLDDDKHPDAKKGRDGNRTAGSLYDLIAAKGKEAKPVGQWNEGRVLVQGMHVEHWLNGKKVVEYQRGSEDFRKLVAQSKYAVPEYNKNGRFGEAPKGHILLQDHGDRVMFRNIKIKTLPKA